MQHRKKLYLGVSLALSMTSVQSQFDDEINLDQLNLSTGFVINGLNPGDQSGSSVNSAGDFNGDGIDDIIIGEPGVDVNGNDNAGSTYIFFGRDGLFGSDMVINGVNAGDSSGRAVHNAGDINGDGIDDITIGAFGADPNGNSFAGSTYVVFGNDTGLPSTLNISDLNGLNGFVINGINANDRSGLVVSSAGDVNGDGIDDIIIGASSTALNGNVDVGSSYVVFGSNTGLPNPLSLSSLNGLNGFVINGHNDRDAAGSSVSSAGDVNGDGIDDIIISAPLADPNGNQSAGSSYVVFGSNIGLPNPLSLSSLNGTNGFVINGANTNDFSGTAVSSAGDVNGDGIDDIIIGAPLVDPNGNQNAGSTYVVFGNDTGFPNPLNLSSINGINGFVLNGISANDRTGASVSSAGDVNADGIDDIIIGAFRAEPNGNSYAGSTYVVFGSDTGLPNPLNLSNLNGLNGFVMNGLNADDRTGASVSSAGDVNADGIDDLIIGSLGLSDNGGSYVIFGREKPIFTNGFEN